MKTHLRPTTQADRLPADWATMSFRERNRFMRRTGIYPPMAGGAPLEEVLAGIDTRLGELAAREAAGDATVAQEREALQRERQQVEDARAAGARTSEEQTELAQLRTERREHEMRSAARGMVEDMAQRHAQARAADDERFRQIAAEEAARALSGEPGRAAIVDTLRATREPSQAVTDHTTPEYAAAVAAGEVAQRSVAAQAQVPGAGVQVQDAGSLSAPNVTRGAQALLDSKSFVKFFKSVVDMKEGWASEDQRQFLIEMRNKAMAEGTDSAGGFLVHPEWMDDILPLLRAQAVVLRANPRSQPFAKQMNQTSVSSGAAAFYTLENARIPTSEMVLAEAPILTPKNLTAMVPISRYLLEDASPEAEAMVRQELVEVLALRGDLAFLQGTGSGGEPRGFKNVVGVTSNPVSPGTDGVQLTLAQFRRIVAALDEQEGSMFRPVLFWNPVVLTYLSTLQEMSGGSPTGRLLVDSGLLKVNEDRRSGTFDGIPFFSTNQIPKNITLGMGTTTYMMLVNMAEAIVGLNKSLEIAVSTEASYTTDGGATWQSAFQQNQALFRAIERHDIAHRRPSQIIVQNGVLY